MASTYTKLRDGSWGIRATEPVDKGQVVSVTKKSGETSTETIRAIVWSGNGVWLCSVEPKAKTPVRAEKGCGRCCRTATRTAQIWEECSYCGCEPIYV